MHVTEKWVFCEDQSNMKIYRHKQLTCVCVCERCHKLQVLLHKCSLVHYRGTGGRHKGHGGTWGRRCFWSEKGQTWVCCTDLRGISWTPKKIPKIKMSLLRTLVLLNGCYSDILLANTNMSHYRRTVMTSFADAGDHIFFYNSTV